MTSDVGDVATILQYSTLCIYKQTVNMANSTLKGSLAIHGGNPQVSEC